MYLGGTDPRIINPKSKDKDKGWNSYTKIVTTKPEGVISIPGKKVFFHPDLGSSEVRTNSLMINTLKVFLGFICNSRCCTCVIGKACKVY